MWQHFVSGRLIFAELFILQKRDTYGAWEHYLGLEHTDSAPKRSHTTNQVRDFLHVCKLFSHEVYQLSKIVMQGRKSILVLLAIAYSELL